MGIVSTIQILLNDSGVFWPQTQILDAVNEAQLWVFAQTKWARKSWPITLVKGVDIIETPGDLLIPGWMESQVLNSDGSISHNRCFPTTQRELEHFLRTWRSAGLDTPQYFVIWEHLVDFVLLVTLYCECLPILSRQLVDLFGPRRLPLGFPMIPVSNSRTVGCD